MIDPDIDYLRTCLQQANLIPYAWDGEDKNIGAFRSKQELIEWYGQPPGIDGEPYRDRGFYTRELAYLSRTIKPRTIVEFGTSLGIGTCLLRWLNPTTELVTVDINSLTYMPGDTIVDIGYLARYQNINCKYVTSDSRFYCKYGIDLCFIDGDHSYEAVLADSARAWLNSSANGNNPWAIAWHDHNDRHPGVMQAVYEFCTNKNITLQQRPDSDTVWIEGGQ